MRPAALVPTSRSSRRYNRTRSCPQWHPAGNTSRLARRRTAALCPDLNGLVALAPEKSTSRLCIRKSSWVSWPYSAPTPANITNSRILKVGIRLRVLLWRLQSPTRIGNWRPRACDSHSGESHLPIPFDGSRKKSCEKCDCRNGTYSRDFEFNSISLRVRTSRVAQHTAAPSPPAFESHRNAWVRFVFRLCPFGLRQRLVPAHFRRQGLPFHCHPGSASAGVALFRQRLTRITLQRRTLLGGIPVMDVPGHSPERLERRKRRAARELRSPRLPGLLLYLLFRYLAPPLPPVDVRPDRERRVPCCSVASRLEAHRRRPRRGPLPDSAQLVLCQLQRPGARVAARNRFLPVSVSPAIPCADGWPVSRESCSPPSTRSAPDREAASLPRPPC